MAEKNRIYIAIDLKSFYASVECIERGLDPLTTNLVVADASRTEKTICLAVSPSLKAYGIQTSFHYPPVHHFLIYRKAKPMKSFSLTHKLIHHVISQTAILDEADAVPYLLIQHIGRTAKAFQKKEFVFTPEVAV